MAQKPTTCTHPPKDPFYSKQPTLQIPNSSTHNSQLKNSCNTYQIPLLNLEFNCGVEFSSSHYPGSKLRSHLTIIIILYVFLPLYTQ
jgi:hypothetical protein